MRANRNLPKLDYLLAFEAVALSGSIAAAARDLNISESAISRKIKLLEEHYKIELFSRHGKSISITLQGQDLINQIQPAINSLRNISDMIRTNPTQRSVIIAATNSVSSLWLLPKIRQLRELVPNTSIKLRSSDDDRECLEPENDLIILRGEGEWENYDAKRLFGETVFPVCSPDFMGEADAPKTLDDLFSSRLIEVSSNHPEWMSWKTWLYHKTGIFQHFENTMSFNTYPLAVQAAIDGFGVTLGWRHLVDQYLDTGQLVRPLGNHAVRTQDGYYLLSQKKRAKFEEQKTVEAFLIDTSHHRKKSFVGGAPEITVL